MNRDTKSRLQLEKKLIENWFKETDYFANKYVRGEWNDNTPKWVEYIKEAKVKAKRLEEIIELIKGLE
jgi:hypothetical protein